uniref:Neck appendage protein n=1 Tax=Siphoviridae sp. ct7xv9 TaxID=2825355 RepID=A0A8S5PMA6_9CAUD|nr:MAG TPA: Neck appendage protein [Siphoviridae sp. ct7xv9]
MPLNAAYADEIVQEDNSTYQLSFRFPTSDSLWEKLKEETFLTADDLHGEQDFVIFEIEKKHGYIQVYANQVFTLLNNYVVNPISLDRQTGSTALSRFAGSITRDNPFSFFSDIEDRHTFNIGSKNAMEAFAKDKHSIIGQWGGDLVRHGYQVRLLKNGGSENESLFMYQKNLSSYQHKTSTKSLKTRITFIATVKGEGEKAPDRTFTVTIDSPLINKYSQIYEDVIEVNDQDVKDEASLRKYGEQYYRTSLCDMMEDSLEIEVVGRSDMPVQIYDIVSLFHEVYNLDVRKKITKYTYSPMGKKLKTIGFGQFQSGFANAIGNAVSDAVKGEAQQLQSDFERQLARELKNADLAFDRQKEDLVNQFQDGMGAAYSKAEEVRMEVLDTIDQRFSSFDNGPLQEIKRKAIEALQNAGASGLLAQEAKRIGLDSITKLEEFKRQTFNTQSALSGAIDALKRTVASEVNQASEYRRTTTEALSRMTGQMNGFATKSEVAQGIDGLTERFAKMRVGGVNLLRNTASLLIGDRSKGYWMSSSGGNGRAVSVEVLDPPKNMIKNMIRIIGNTNGGNKDLAQLVRLLIGEKYTISCYARVASDSSHANVNLLFRSWANDTDLNQKFQKSISHKNWQKYSFTFTANAIENSIQFGQSGAGIIEICAPKIESGTLATDWSPAPEDTDGLITEAKATFERTAQGLRTDLSAIQEYVNKDGQRQETLQRYTREESARQVNAVRELVNRDFVGKATYQEDVRGINQRIEEAKKNASNELTTRLANYRQTVDGKFTDISSQVTTYKQVTDEKFGNLSNQIVNNKNSTDGQIEKVRNQLAKKVEATDFQRVQETSKLYERIIGSNENDISNKVARMALTNQLFQIEVSKNEGLKTVQRQIAGSWAVQNINSAGDLISGINLGANGHNRFVGKLTHITGETQIDNAVIKSAMVDKLKTANFEAGSVTTVVLDAEAVTAEKLKVDQAFFNKLVANEAYLNRLFAKQAFINRVQSVAIDASQVRSGILSGDRIYGGTIRGAEINGTRITGDSRITIGDNGFLRPTEYGGLQINVPETFNASKGIGVQLLGRNFGEFPKGMFIYNAPNWNGGNLIGESVSDTLLTVKGLTSLCNLFNGKPMSGLPINSNFRFGEPVQGVFRVSFIAWDPRYGQLMVNDGTNTKGTWWFKPDPSSSDKRLKVNIQDTDFEATDFVKKLEFKQFDWKPDKFGYKKPYTNVGLIAQDVEKLDSSLVYSQGENLALDDFRLGNIALKAIQELSQRIETLERKLA